MVTFSLRAARRAHRLAGIYGAMIARFAAGSLSAGFLAAATAQVIVVLRHAHGGIFWP